MTRFADDFETSFEHLLYDFGEQIVYVPANGAERPIDAQVNRSAGQAIDFSGGIVSYRIIIEVHNNASCGIASHELDQGTANIKVARRVGGPLTELCVAQLINAEGGVTKIAVV